MDAVASSGKSALLIGTWTLVDSIVADKAKSRRGANPTGLLTYTASGHLAVQIDPDIPFSVPQDFEEAMDRIRRYSAYFGTYSVDDVAGTVTHVRIANLNGDRLGPLVRKFEISNDLLTLLPLESANRLVWRRVS